MTDPRVAAGFPDLSSSREAACRHLWRFGGLRPNPGLCCPAPDYPHVRPTASAPATPDPSTC